MPTIYLIGDSTVDDNQEPFRGWGWALPRFVREGVSVRNHALSGRSTRSFLNEGLFAPVQAAMRPGDLLMIQFGHNDEKDDPARHTDPQGSYTECLGRYCDAAQAAGALPVLLTPVSRRYFYADGNELLYTRWRRSAACPCAILSETAARYTCRWGGKKQPSYLCG